MAINQGVRQGCSLSPSLFNMYIDEILREWMNVCPAGIRISDKGSLSTLLYADDQIIIGKSENELQRSIYTLHTICQKYNFKI